MGFITHPNFLLESITRSMYNICREHNAVSFLRLGQVMNLHALGRLFSILIITTCLMFGAFGCGVLEGAVVGSLLIFLGTIFPIRITFLEIIGKTICKAMEDPEIMKAIEEIKTKIESL